MTMITGPFDFDMMRRLKGAKNKTKGPVRILSEALVLHVAITEHEVEAGRISHTDMFSPEIQRYEKSALGSTRII